MIALCDVNGEPETWEREASTLREHIFDTAAKCGSKRRSLRSKNKQHSHPAIRWKMPTHEAAEWRTVVLRVMNEHKLAPVTS